MMMINSWNTNAHQAKLGKASLTSLIIELTKAMSQASWERQSEGGRAGTAAWLTMEIDMVARANGSPMMRLISKRAESYRSMVAGGSEGGERREDGREGGREGE
jgi:hypothetical protein